MPSLSPRQSTMNTTSISIIMPSFNEESHIEHSIYSLVDDFVKQHAEILVLDGGSNDNTVPIVQKLIEKGLPIRLIHNEKKIQAHALNLGISAALGSTIVRVDAHSIYPAGYVREVTRLLESSDAVNVGGVMLPRGHTSVQQAIAMAMQHKVGVGDAKFHLGGYQGYVDTVYLGTFEKSIFEKIGLYDTNCYTNEDAELNIRILKHGEKIYLDSSIQVEYLPRESFGKLALQYYRYGKGRAYTTKKHNRITSLRQLAPPLLILSLLSTALLGIFFPIFFAYWGIYLLTIFTVSLTTSPVKGTSIKTRLFMGVAFITMHLSWGTGFLCYFLTPNKIKHSL